MLSAVVRVASRSGSVRCAASLQAEEVLALFHPSYVQTKDSALQGAVDKYTAALAAAGLNKAGTSASALAAFASKFAASNPDAASLLLQAPVRVSQVDASRRKMIESGDQYLRDVQYVWDALASSSNGGEVSLAAFAEWAERNAEVKKALRRIRDVTPFQSPNDASMRKKPVRVAVTGGAGAIGYSLLFRIASGEMLGAQQPVHLSIIDLPDALPKLKGTIMELEDCAFPLLAGVSGTADLNEGFQDAKFALLVGARPRSKGMERADLMAANAAIFAEQGKALNAVAHPTVKVLVVGNPANTNALIAKANAPNLDPANFTAMTRLDQNRAISMLAKKLGCAVDDIDRFALWGNHSPTMYPDVSHASVKGEWVKPKVDQAWYVNEFIPRVGKRGAEILEARGASSAASAASAAIDHMRDWHLGSDGRWVSMGVPSDGSYGIDEGIIYSVPVVCEGGEYKRVHGLPIDEFSAERMEITRKELESEKDLIKHLLPTSSAAVSVGDKKKKLVETQDPAERDRLYGELKSEAAKKGK